MQQQLAVSTLADQTDGSDDIVADERWLSLDLVYEELQESATAQIERLKSIDTKANFGLVAGTLLTAGVTGLGRALLDATQSAGPPTWSILGVNLAANQVVDALTVLSLGAYALIAFCTFQAYRLRMFQEAPNPEVLVTKYIYEPPRITKGVIIDARADNLATNEKVIGQKVVWTKRAMVFLVVEALLLFVIGIVEASQGWPAGLWRWAGEEEASARRANAARAQTERATRRRVR